jgi:hypothetical protein
VSTLVLGTYDCVAGNGQACVLTFLATTSSLATDLTAAGGDGMGDGAVARFDIVILRWNAREGWDRRSESVFFKM